MLYKADNSARVLSAPQKDFLTLNGTERSTEVLYVFIQLHQIIKNSIEVLTSINSNEIIAEEFINLQ